MTPVYDAGPSELMSKYRPKSVFSPYAKIFEKIYQQLYNFLRKQNILCDDQFGYPEMHSTTLAITDVYDFFKTVISKHFTCTILLDLKTAFRNK